MKIAVGVLAFRAPDTLRETLLHWPADWEIFVHVDAKADLELFAFLHEAPNVTLIPERFDALWGGFNVVRAELALMQAALSDDLEVFLLHSDDSVPLMSSARMMEVLADTHRWVPMTPTGWELVLGRYASYVSYDVAAANPQHHGGERAFGLGDVPTLQDLITLLRHGKKQIEDLYHRSQWKAVFGPDVGYVLEQHRTDALQRESFRFSAIPDEMYIPTILGNKAGGTRLPDRYMWADFSKDPKPYQYADLAEFDAPLAEDYMFVRKVRDAALARALLEKIGAR